VAAVAPRAVRLVAAERKAAVVPLAVPEQTQVARKAAVVLLAAPEQMQAACRAAAEPLAVPERMPVARKVVVLQAADRVAAVPRAAEPMAAALRVAVEHKAAVLTAAVAPQVGPAHRVAAPRVVLAVIRQRGAEPLAAAVLKALKAAELKVAAVPKAVANRVPAVVAAVR
jgi:hypothetical protein